MFAGNAKAGGGGGGCLKLVLAAQEKIYLPEE